MEYFTLSEDLEGIQSSKLKLRNHLIAVLGLIVLFFTIRGFGLLTIEYNRVYLQGKHENRKEIQESYNDGTGRVNTNDGSLKTNDDRTNWNLGFNFKASEFLTDEKVYLEKLVKQRISNDKSLSRQFEFSVIAVEKLETSGAYWLPLIKKGTSSYRVSVENRFFSDTYSADFTGDIDFEIYGLCTVKKLNGIIADKIAKIVVDSIKEDYKK
jgi:hypothetical protein